MQQAKKTESMINFSKLVNDGETVTAYSLLLLMLLFAWGKAWGQTLRRVALQTGKPSHQYHHRAIARSNKQNRRQHDGGRHQMSERLTLGAQQLQCGLVWLTLFISPDIRHCAFGVSRVPAVWVELYSLTSQSQQLNANILCGINPQYL
jgi:hypothetical protein